MADIVLPSGDREGVTRPRHVPVRAYAARLKLRRVDGRTAAPPRTRRRGTRPGIARFLHALSVILSRSEASVIAVVGPVDARVSGDVRVVVVVVHEVLALVVVDRRRRGGVGVHVDDVGREVRTPSHLGRTSTGSSSSSTSSTGFCARDVRVFVALGMPAPSPPGWERSSYVYVS